MAIDTFIGIPKTLTAKNHGDFRAAFLLTYAALRSFTSLEPASENFSRCFPGIRTICAVYGQGRRTVFHAITWLEKEGYLFRTPQHRQRGTTLYTLVLQREWFLGISRSQGRAAAIEEYESWIAEEQEVARVEKAKDAQGRRRDIRNERQPGNSASECPSVHPVHGKTPRGEEEAASECPPVHSGGAQTEPVSLGAPRSRSRSDLDQQHHGNKARAATPEAFPISQKLSPETPKEETIEQRRERAKDGLADFMAVLPALPKGA